jgi:hypothetical protein
LSIAATSRSDGTTMAAILTKSARVDETEMKRRREDGGIKQMDNGMSDTPRFSVLAALVLIQSGHNT